MNFTLNSNNSIYWFKNLNELKNSCDVEYYALDIATDLKGPIFTMTNYMPVMYSSAISIDYTVEHDTDNNEDYDTLSIHNTIKPKSINNVYSIYPLLFQIMDLDMIVSEFEAIVEELLIIEIEFNSDIISFPLKVDYDYMFTLPSLAKKALKKAKLKTSVSKFYTNTNLIIKKDRWQNINSALDISDIDFDYVGIEIYNAECFYLLTYEEYHRFKNVKGLTITRIINDDLTTSLSASSLYQILYYCLYYPQYEQLASYVFPDKEVSCIIEVETYSRTITLSIEPNEVKAGICLYDIINRILLI